MNHANHCKQCKEPYDIQSVRIVLGERFAERGYCSESCHNNAVYQSRHERSGNSDIGDFALPSAIGCIRIADLLGVEIETEIHKFDLVLIRFRSLPAFETQKEDIELKPYAIGMLDGDRFVVLGTARVSTHLWDQFPFLEQDSDV